MANKKGLKPKHHSELNKARTSAARLRQLRAKYKGDKVAQQQIDVYDSSTGYHRKFDKFVAAMKNRDRAQEGILMKWFKKFYPDVRRES